MSLSQNFVLGGPVTPNVQIGVMTINETPTSFHLIWRMCVLDFLHLYNVIITCANNIPMRPGVLRNQTFLTCCRQVCINEERILQTPAV